MAPALPVRPAGCRQTEKNARVYLANRSETCYNESAGGTVAGGMRRNPVPLIRNPN